MEVEFSFVQHSHPDVNSVSRLGFDASSHSFQAISCNILSSRSSRYSRKPAKPHVAILWVAAATGRVEYLTFQCEGYVCVTMGPVWVKICGSGWSRYSDTPPRPQIFGARDYEIESNGFVSQRDFTRNLAPSGLPEQSCGRTEYPGFSQ